MKSQESGIKGNYKDARDYFQKTDPMNTIGLDPRSGTQTEDLSFKKESILKGGIESEKVASNIASKLKDLEERQLSRQQAYKSELSKYSDPFQAMISREREKKLLDQLYSRAIGRQENAGDIEARILAKNASSGFQRSLPIGGSVSNPLMQARAVEQAAQRNIAGTESDAANRRLSGILSERQRLLDATGQLQSRDKQIQDTLRELKFGEQREREALSNEMARNVIERSQNQINDLEQDKARERAESMQAATAGVSAVGTILAAALMAASDERTKKKVKDGKGSIDIILETVGPVEYEYKDEYKDDSNAGRGKHLGVMAQSLEKAGLDGIVTVDPLTGMKVIDTVKMIPLLLAAQSRLNEKIDEKQDKKSNKGGNKK